MKIIRILSLSLLALTLTYCSSDDSSDATDDGAIVNPQDTSDQEGTVLDPNTVVDGLVISGGTKITASAPVANSNLSFTLENNGSALLNEGFSINFNANDNIAGAYLIISDNTGTQASSYYDIPESAFGRSQETTTSNLLPSHRLADGEQEINVGFSTSIPVGEFCYSLCVYDASGAISQPQEVCITVESWGGNNGLIGDWTLTRYQETYNGMSVDAGTNEEYCFTENISCNNGNSLSYSECSIIEYLTMKLEANGTYTVTQRSTDKYLNYDASITSCTAVYDGTTFYEYTSQGNWAYNGTIGNLVLAEYSKTENDNGSIINQTNAPGDAYIVFDNPITLSGNTIILSVDEGGGDTYTYTFEK